MMDLLSSDLLVSFFTAALNSYKHDSLVRPFPSDFFNENNEKDFSLLLSTVNQLPLLHEIDWNNACNINEKCLQLTKWIICPKRFKLKKILLQKFSNIEQLCGESDKAVGIKPDFLFEVVYNQQEEDKFRTICGNNDIIYAYHGSRAENFHSILHNGLRNNLNKVSLFGEGIYLSSDMRVCQSFSPSGYGWERSLLGSSLSCIAVCQLVDHPDVKCSVKRSSQSAFATDSAESPDAQLRQRQHLDQADKEADDLPSDTAGPSSEVKTSVTCQQRSSIRGSEGGQIPDKYYVVRNDDLVRVKYLYVFAPDAKKDLIRKLLSGGKVNDHPLRVGPVRQFMRRYKFFLVMLFYVFLLFFISIWNSRAFSSWWRNVVKGGEEDSVFLPK